MNQHVDRYIVIGSTCQPLKDKELKYRNVLERQHSKRHVGVWIFNGMSSLCPCIFVI